MKKHKFIYLLLALVIALPAFTSCSKPPELESVKETFVALIEASVEVNEIFFGEGLPTYPRVEGDGNLCFYEDKESNTKAYYMFIKDGDRTILKYQINGGEWQFAEKTKAPAEVEPIYTDKDGFFYYPTEYDDSEFEYVYDENSPKNYDYVRVDCKYQDIQSIMELAESVYSTAYLKGEDWQEGDLAYGGVYSAMFDGMALGTEIVYARYSTSDSLDDYFLLKSNQFEPYFDKHTTYDYDTMVIVKPSKADVVNVELTAYGRYIDFESLEVVYGEHKVTLTFVLENGEWRLDTPTY
ncbi:MAG: hypothetical protein ACI3XI_01850 [Eubacteriales bacterium]